MRIIVERTVAGCRSFRRALNVADFTSIRRWPTPLPSSLMKAINVDFRYVSCFAYGVDNDQPFPAGSSNMERNRNAILFSFTVSFDVIFLPL